MQKTIDKVGFWSAVISAICAIMWFITYSFKDMFSTVPDWHNLEAYAAAYTPIRLLYIYPSLVLAISFIALLVCIHLSMPKDRQVWSLTGLGVGIVYSTMASINYNIQAVTVRLSLANGETNGIAMFLPDNLNSVFTAMANSYVYMAIAMVFVGFAFNKTGPGKSIRFLFLAQIVTAVGQIAWSMFDLNEGLFIATSMVWVIGAPLAFILLAISFRRNLEGIISEQEAVA